MPTILIAPPFSGKPSGDGVCEAAAFGLSVKRFTNPLTKSVQLRLLTLCVCLLMASSLDRVRPAWSSDPAAAELSRFVDLLDADDYAQRESAMAALGAMGDRAVPRLVSAARKADNLELAWRAVVTLQLLANSSQISVQDAAIDGLEQLAADAPRMVSSHAEQFLRLPQFDRHHRAVAALRRLGGAVSHGSGRPTTVRLDEQWKGGLDGLALLKRLERLVDLKLERSSVTDDDLSELPKLRDVQRLYLGGSQLRGPGLAHVAKIPELKYLSLRGLQLEPGSLSNLSDIRNLENLGLDETNVADADLGDLPRKARLNRLWLNRTKITSAGLQHLKKLPELNTLYLSGTDISGEGIAHLAEVASLRFVSFQHVALTNEDAKAVGRLAQLQTLGLDDTKIGDQGAAHLKDLKNLQTLWLSNTKVSDASIIHLKQLVNLKRIYLNGTRVSRQGIDQLRRALPKCTVIH